MKPVLVALAILAGVVLLALSLVWRAARSDSMLKQWAKANDLTLLEAEYRTFFKGPFFWTSTKGQMVYFVTVRDPGGRTRHGWVRCGGHILGMLSEKVDTRWED
jgi:hypothetical protein